LAGQAWLGWTRTGGLAGLDRGGEYWGLEVKRGVIVLDKKYKTLREEERKERQNGGRINLLIYIDSLIQLRYQISYYPFPFPPYCVEFSFTDIITRKHLNKHT
jgi:hypothetical protein